MTDASFKYYAQTDFFHGSIARVMGTRFDAIVRGLSESVSARIWEEMKAILENDESIFDRFSPQSELSKVNLSLKNGQAVALGEELAEAFRCACVYKEKTRGLFDISRRDLSLFTLENDILGCSTGDSSLDFGGFAKGWALKRIAGLLKHNGVTSAFVDFGGSSIYAMGAHPAGECWQVDLDSPFDGSRVDTFQLRDMALSVSGNTPAYGSHIIDPKSGRIVTGKIMSSVVCADPLQAEVLSTAAMIGTAEDLVYLQNTYSETEIKKYSL